MRHLINIDDIETSFISTIFQSAAEYKIRRLDAMRPGASHNAWDYLSDRLKNYLLITDFFEPSTRTRLSFEAAMTYMGGNVIGTENAAEFSSFKKGESLSDNFRVISGYGDIIVGRFLHEGDAKIAASASSIPVINGGDGKGEHPTQALIDLFSIIEKFPENTASDLHITFVGDNLHSRTVQSLARLLARFDPIRRMTFIGHEEQNFDPDDKTGFLHSLREIAIAHGRADGDLGFLCLNELTEDIIRSSDIVYVTRSQIERHNNMFVTLDPTWHVKIDKPSIVLTPELANMMPERSMILHPLPRNSELPPEIDENPRAYYFQQAHNGLFIRMAILEILCMKN